MFFFYVEICAEDLIFGNKRFGRIGQKQPKRELLYEAEHTQFVKKQCQIFSPNFSN